MRQVLCSTAFLLGVSSATGAMGASVVTSTPLAGRPGLSVTVSGTGFGDGEAIDVYMDTTDTVLLVSTATGTFSGSVTIPVAAQPGTHYLTAIGRKSGDAGQVKFNVTTPWYQPGFGAAHNTYNPYENTVNVSNVGSLGMLWDVTANGSGGLGGTPAVGAGRVIVGTNSGLDALAASTGATVWTSSITTFASATVSANVVYIGAASGSFYALSATTGKIIWSTLLGSSVDSSAAVVNGIVYVGCSDDKVYALNASTGGVDWTYTTGAIIDSSPTVVGGVVYIGSQDSKVYALNAASGALIWSYATNGPVESTPAVVNGVVYVGSDDGNVYALRAKGPNEGGLLWKYNTGNDVFESPAVAYGTVYIGSANGTMYALNAATGGLEWQFTTGGRLGNAAVADGVVYATAGDGSFYAFDAYYGGTLLTGQTGDTFLGSPVVSDGIVYLSTYGADIYAFALGAGFNTVPVRPPVPALLHRNPSLVASK
jgi:outer membrane protein assembly factor BamB